MLEKTLATTKVGRAKLYIALMTEAFKGEEHYLEKIEYLINVLNDMGFFTAPASAKHHGNYEGGLFDHSYQTTLELLDLTEKLGIEWPRKESPYLIGMLHDVCKCDNYIFDEELQKYEYNKDMILSGHGDKSAILAQKLWPLLEEEILCIRWHMGAYDDKENYNSLNAAIKKYPNILYVHLADMIASQVKGI